MKIKIWLIRHGMTAGNREQRYVGTTDELLCEEGRQQIILKKAVDKVGSGYSRMFMSVRCSDAGETVNSVSGGQSDKRSGFRECSFRRI